MNGEKKSPIKSETESQNYGGLLTLFLMSAYCPLGLEMVQLKLKCNLGLCPFVWTNIFILQLENLIAVSEWSELRCPLNFDKPKTDGKLTFCTLQ